MRVPSRISHWERIILPDMKASSIVSLMMAVMAVLMTGCSTTESTALRVSGTPGAQFIAQYRTATLSGNVHTVILGGPPSTVLEVSGEHFTCDIAKENPASHLNAEVRQGGKLVYRAEAPPNTRGVRISHEQGEWRQETY